MVVRMTRRRRDPGHPRRVASQAPNMPMRIRRNPRNLKGGTVRVVEHIHSHDPTTDAAAATAHRCARVDEASHCGLHVVQ